jgi:hypothetical protein
MDLNEIMIKLMAIQERQEQGEMTQEDIEYVKDLWEKLKPIIRRFNQLFVAAMGKDVSRISRQMRINADAHRAQGSLDEAARRRIDIHNFGLAMGLGHESGSSQMNPRRPGRGA